MGDEEKEEEEEAVVVVSVCVGLGCVCMCVWMRLRGVQTHMDKVAVRKRNFTWATMCFLFWLLFLLPAVCSGKRRNSDSCNAIHAIKAGKT